MGSPKPISLRQALILVRRRTGIEVKLHRLRTLVEKMVAAEWLDARVLNDEILPDDLDRMCGEVVRSVSGWFQRRNVRGDFLAWVVVEGQDDRLLPLPYERVYDAHTKTESVGAPERVECWEWPTALLTGALARCEGDRDGYPVYEYRPIEEEKDSGTG